MCLKVWNLLFKKCIFMHNGTFGIFIILYTGTRTSLWLLVKLWPVSTLVWDDSEQIAVPVLFTWPFPCSYQGFTPAQCGQWEVSYLLLCESHCKRRGRCFTAVCLCLVCARVRACVWRWSPHPSYTLLTAWACCGCHPSRRRAALSGMAALVTGCRRLLPFLPFALGSCTGLMEGGGGGKKKGDPLWKKKKRTNGASLQLQYTLLLLSSTL